MANGYDKNVYGLRMQFTFEFFRSEPTSARNHTDIIPVIILAACFNCTSSCE